MSGVGGGKETSTSSLIHDASADAAVQGSGKSAWSYHHAKQKSAGLMLYPPSHWNRSCERRLHPELHDTAKSDWGPPMRELTTGSRTIPLVVWHHAWLMSRHASCTCTEHAAMRHMLGAHPRVFSAICPLHEKLPGGASLSPPHLQQLLGLRLFVQAACTRTRLVSAELAIVVFVS